MMAVWGSGPTDVYAAGYDNGIFRFDGAGWKKTAPTPLTASPINSIWGSGPTDVFAAGAGNVFHFDGKSWTKMQVGKVKDLRSIWGVNAAGRDGLIHYDGASWKPVELPTGEWLNRVWGLSSTEVYVVGPSGLLHYKGP